MPLALLAELKRRRVFRALIGYGIVTFAVLQIIEPVMHGLHWPDAVLSYVVVALALGFPIVVTLAWIFDVNQGRVERTGSAGSPAGARLAIVLAGRSVSSPRRPVSSGTSSCAATALAPRGSRLPRSWCCRS